ncbi:Na+/proline symporter [Yoonia tamlensis]|uniref:Na+/proline symporter n=1 Tax=Yoonia tamlensis TaxID=390270 RepID=A0A1I6G2B4_9RHOB|nr:hypothetical protein [Yoonia tamlensis]SFR36326.1 Na+/proline symporter [Yoonia tamlensis]
MFHVSAAQTLAVLGVLLVPLVMSAWDYLRRGGIVDAGQFALNSGGNGWVCTTAGAISGNVGVGTFLALFLFSQNSPIIGFAIALAYTSGLFLCAALAPILHARGEHFGIVGLVDLITKSHGLRHQSLIWMPLAIVFVLRSAVQIGALGLLVQASLPGQYTVAVVICTAVLGLYLVIGGYQAAVQSDVFQAAVLLGAIGFVALNLTVPTTPTAPVITFGTHHPAILIGICLFIPFSALLAVDNWQRITIAQTPQIARQSYVVAGIVCGFIYGVICLVGYFASPAQTMQAAFEMMLPAGMGWVVIAMLTACIMSSVDTFIMPLTNGLGPNLSIKRMRFIVVALLTITAVVSILMGDLINQVITAFNTLSVFLPVALGSLFLKAPGARAAFISMNAGVFSALFVNFFAQDFATIVGFMVASISYYAFQPRATAMGVS